MDETINSYLTFTVNGGLYGVHVTRVVEIQAYDTPDASPAGLPYMLGLIKHRGDVIPLIDSAAKFGMKPMTITEQTYVVIISVDKEGHPFDVALAVDEVREVVKIEQEGRKDIDTTYKPGYVSFAAPTDGGLAMILQPDKIFTDTDVISMSTITKDANKATNA
ncbi:MAG: chemotaxis protein CheW [Bacteroidales bacterium]|nr:chemotaxis protein CheW [Bacteroidales bacterium]MDD7724264.1 chemotaxis protein CheW [Bacteroidales bacterium]MDY4174918.1 chemotaxis protein CheW [Bacteroidales bacterium]